MARLGPSRGSKAAAVALLSVGLLGVGLLVSVAQASPHCWHARLPLLQLQNF